MTADSTSSYFSSWSTIGDTIVGGSTPAAPSAPAARDSAADLLAVLTEAMSATEFSVARRQLAGGLARWSGCERLVLGLAGRSGVCRVEEVTGLAMWDERAEWVRVAESCLDDTLLRREVNWWSAASENASPLFRQLRNFTALDAVVGIPLCNSAGRPLGAMLLCGSVEWLAQEQSLDRLSNCRAPVAACLDLLIEGRGRAWSRWRARWNQWRGRGGLPFLATAAAVLAGLAFVPFPYRIKCEMVVEPVIRRFIAAPFDGTLERSLVEPGDLVKEGHVLATMDERELRWELAGLDAELSAARKRRDTALANRDAISAQLAGLEMDQIDARIQTLRHRTSHLQLQCPIDGVVVAGDLKRTEGAPLTVGQTLFEIAPLTEMIAEVEILQDEVAHVSVGGQVELRFDAFPARTWVGAIERIHPRAELRDHQTVFVADVRLENSDELLRPGMSGHASISAASRPLGWIVLRRPLLAWRQKVGW